MPLLCLPMNSRDGVWPRAVEQLRGVGEKVAPELFGTYLADRADRMAFSGDFT